MEPRIATLLGDSSTRERITLDPLLLLPPLSVPPRAHPVEPTPAADDAHGQAQRRSEHGPDAQQASGVHSRQRAGAPLAKVLNDEASAHLPLQPRPAQLAATPAPFSGRLSDILLDPSQEHQNKRRRVDQDPPHALTGSENSLLRLPELPQLPKKPSRRPRIPPLLQGLHQPPPLPQGRLFPPITGEAGAFGRDISERGIIRSPADVEKTKEKEAPTASEPSSSRAGSSKPKKNNGTLTSRPASDKENQAKDSGAGDKDNGGKQVRRRRTKWSEQETKDLLLGVKRFGIGSWKQILQCEDFNLGQRTAVDLKDRFRTLCPGEGLKMRPPQQKRASGGEGNGASQDSATLPISTQDEQSSQEVPAASKTARKVRSDREQKLTADLADLGIDGPFAKSTRRQRREFTEIDDENLLKGYERHNARPGLLWRSIRDDPDLGFAVRQPTDLRDRFRIRYPDKYVEAGKKPKQKTERKVDERQAEETAPPAAPTPTASRPEEDDGIAAQSLIPTTAPAERSFRPQPMMQSMLGTFRQTVDELPDFMSEDGDIGNRSPITLSRHIFDWADANPSIMHSNAASAGAPTVASITADMGVNLFAQTDTSINSFIMPSKISQSTSMSAVTASYMPPSHNPSKPFAHPSTAPSTTTTTTTPTTTTTSSSSSTTSLPTRQDLTSLMRTPNLPTIVVPPVPMSSARSAVHNLPPPSDLLSGLDMDVRQEAQAPYYLDGRLEPQLPYYLDGGRETQTGCYLEETGGHYLTMSGGGTSILAPLMNGGGIGGGGRGSLAVERGVLDGGLGERSLLNSAL